MPEHFVEKRIMDVHEAARQHAHHANTTIDIASIGDAWLRLQEIVMEKPALFEDTILLDISGTGNGAIIRVSRSASFSVPGLEERFSVLSSFLRMLPLRSNLRVRVLINLHDNPQKQEFGIPQLTWSSDSRIPPGVALIPNMYALNGSMQRYVDEARSARNPTNTKVAFFAGSDTGYDGGPRQVLTSAAADRKWLDVRIIVAQHGFWTPPKKQTIRKKVKIAKQARHMYLLNADGNSASWDRMAWILASKCVPIYFRPRCMNWYDLALQKGVHYLAAENVDDIKDIMHKFNNNKALREEVVKQGQQFARNWFSSEAVIAYMVELLNSLDCSS
jgi:hypothetical protein